MAKLSDFRSDSKAISDGLWVLVDEVMFDDIEILSRGYTDEFIDAQNAMIRKWARRYNGDKERITNAEYRDINATLMREYLVIDVRGLNNDDDKPVTVTEFHEMLFKNEYTKLARAVWEAAGRVTMRTDSQRLAAEGNSRKL